MATHDDGAQLARVNAREAMALGLGLAAAEAAGEATAIGGYTLTPEDAQRVTRGISEAVLAMVALVENWSETTDEQLEEAARDLGFRVVRNVLGAPPWAAN